MKILLTGANGYIGRNLLPLLLQSGHQVFVFVHRSLGFQIQKEYERQLVILQGDLLDKKSLEKIPKEIEAAYYLVHSMSSSLHNFAELEKECAQNFILGVSSTQIKQIIYLSGIVNDQNLSIHLKSRKAVGEIFKQSGIPYTILQSAVVIGSGSASFEIIRDLVEKLPLMIAPKWVKSQTQPISIQDLLFYLQVVLGLEKAFNHSFEIGGPDQLTYKQMLLQYAKVRGLKRWIISVPVLTPRLSSYWLYLITSTNIRLATSLIDSLRNATVCKDFHIHSLIPHVCLTYEESIKEALGNKFNPPKQGCMIKKMRLFINKNKDEVVSRIWKIGGATGWYYWNIVWVIRGFIDKLFDGVGLQRGRTHQDRIEVGDRIDFWQVVAANREEARLLLFAEMKLPGEAWLEFKVFQENGRDLFEQTAIFRPKGVLGRLYWYLLLPIHSLLFRGMAKNIVRGS